MQISSPFVYYSCHTRTVIHLAPLFLLDTCRTVSRVERNTGVVLIDFYGIAE
jgi:hypothetical protein